ncbi:YfjI family protein [Paenalcaligenes sp. Me131]|uniref:YfjI family protein n=1 Tax=Paenalcaligenes sp. Me131 TaxID=3392636 RepID=UPI003D291550
MMSNSIHQVFIDALQALPSDLNQTIYAVYNNVQSPLPLITTSVLSTLSSTAQGYFGVETMYGTTQPVSLFTLVVAESGERKTSTDKLIASSLLEHEKNMLSFGIEKASDQEVESLVWEKLRKHLIQQLEKSIIQDDQDQIDKLRGALSTHQKQKPGAIKSTRSILSDVTPAALFQSLAGDGRAITLHSSDAGNLLTRTNMDFISNSNQLWDGDNVTILRKTGDTFITNGRLTLSLMIQPAVLKRISDKKGDLLRLSGYLSRMLVTAPESTQGQRFSHALSDLDEIHLKQFQKRIKQLSMESMHYQANQSKVILNFNPEARHHLTTLYNEVEPQLNKFGWLSDIRDAGSKILNNATRIAALLHAYQHGAANTEIDAKTAMAACKLARYYLLEFAAIFGEKTVYQLGQEYGELLLNWIYRNPYYCFPQTVTRAHILQYGPNRLRKKEKLELALHYLAAQGTIAYFPYHKPPLIQFLRNTGTSPAIPSLYR